MTPFRISEAVFIDSAYISGEAKMSVAAASSGPAGRGPTSVEAIIGLPGGMFVKHRGAWNFCPWANVKSARLVDVPPDVLATAEGDLPTRAPVTADDAARIAAKVRAIVSPEKYEHDDLSESARRARVGKVPVDVPVVPFPPERDAMGVLKSLQPNSGPVLECGACGSKFVQGSNHVCTKPDDLV